MNKSKLKRAAELEKAADELGVAKESLTKMNKPLFDRWLAAKEAKAKAKAQAKAEAEANPDPDPNPEE